MKTITTLLTAMLLWGGSSLMSQNCSANFQYTVNGSTVNFTGQVAPANANTTWIFGDGNYDWNTLNPSHTYLNSGTYTVCLMVYDSMQTCFDSLCQQITVTANPSSCTASFAYTDSSGTMYFTNLSTGTIGYVMWDFGDGNFSYQSNPVHQYLNAGTYTVCLYAYNVNQQLCDSTCTTVTVQGNSNCTANFTWIDSLGTTYFLGTSTLGSGGYYVWDFGDGNFAYQQYPAHQYASAGTYTVCLTVYDSMQNFCDSTCHTVNIQLSSISENSGWTNNLGVVPNPADDQVTLIFETLNGGDVTVRFFDAAGRSVYENTVNAVQGNNRIQLNTSAFRQGIYIVSVEADGVSSWERVSLTHQ